MGDDVCDKRSAIDGLLGVVLVPCSLTTDHLDSLQNSPVTQYVLTLECSRIFQENFVGSAFQVSDG